MDRVRTVVVLLLASLVLVAMAVAPAAAYKYYDGQKAADYAYSNAKNNVPGTWRFSNSGGDCTNFVSHSLQAGGWVEDGGYWYTSSRAWFYNHPYKYGYSHTWTVADRFYDFLNCKGRAYPVSVVRNRLSLKKGDVVQIDYGRDGHWDHTMIVTGKTGNDLLMSYHSTGNPSSTGVRNKRLQEIMDNNPGARFLGWHIHARY